MAFWTPHSSALSPPLGWGCRSGCSKLWGAGWACFPNTRRSSEGKMGPPPCSVKPCKLCSSSGCWDDLLRCIANCGDCKGSALASGKARLARRGPVLFWGAFCWDSWTPAFSPSCSHPARLGSAKAGSYRQRFQNQSRTPFWWASPREWLCHRETLRVLMVSAASDGLSHSSLHSAGGAPSKTGRFLHSPSEKDKLMTNLRNFGLYCRMMQLSCLDTCSFSGSQNKNLSFLKSSYCLWCSCFECPKLMC